MNMICERCRKKKASVIHREVRAGRLAIRHLCGECTEVLEAAGELGDISAALPPYTAPLVEDDGGCFPFFLPPDGGAGAENLPAACPLCGMAPAELTAGGRAGCPQCYTVYADLLAGALLSLRGDAPHRGCLPTAVRERRARTARIESLRTSLREAVAAEQYERAAELRDEIRALEGSGAVESPLHT